MQDTLSRAVQFHHQGRLDKAAPLYRNILAAQPAHPEALHLLGVVALQQRDYARAADLIGRAVGLNPGAAAYHATWPKPTAPWASSTAPPTAAARPCASSRTPPRRSTTSAWCCSPRARPRRPWRNSARPCG